MPGLTGDDGRVGRGAAPSLAGGLGPGPGRLVVSSSPPRPLRLVVLVVHVRLALAVVVAGLVEGPGGVPVPAAVQDGDAPHRAQADCAGAGGRGPLGGCLAHVGCDVVGCGREWHVVEG